MYRAHGMSSVVAVDRQRVRATAALAISSRLPFNRPGWRCILPANRDRGGRMSNQQPNRRAPQTDERSQSPLWFAIASLLVSLASFSMQDLQIGDVVFWGGGVVAAISLVYYFFQPRHGIPTGKR
jgi:hypothetical protein